MIEARFDELLKRLVRADVRFVLIGGLALGARGVIRGTKDADIVPWMDRENLERLASCAIESGGRVQLAEAMIGSVPSLVGLLLAGERVMVETDLGGLDIVQGLDGVPDYEHLDRSATDADVLGVKVRVCSLEDLRAMKKAAGRPRDLLDLEDLEVANRD